MLHIGGVTSYFATDYPAIFRLLYFARGVRGVAPIVTIFTCCRRARRLR